MSKLSVPQAYRKMQSSAARLADLVHVQMETAGQLTDLSAAEIGVRSIQVRAEIAGLRADNDRFAVEIPDGACKGESLHFGDFGVLLQLAEDNGLDVDRLLRGIFKLSGKRLSELDLSFCELTDIGALAACTQLEELSLSDNQLRDITPLAAVTGLKSLGLQNNKLTDISAIAALTQLQALSLASNQFTDVSALAVCTQLEFLNLIDTPLSQKAKAFVKELRAKGVKVVDC